MPVNQVHQDHQAMLVSKVIQETLAIQAVSELLVLLEQLANKVLLV
jgi:hypothetical protein